MLFASRYVSFCGLLIVLMVFLGGPVPLAEEKPWALRNRYSMPSASATLDYSESNGAWRVYQSGNGMDPLAVIADDVSFSITLAGGRQILPGELGMGTSSREPHSGKFGTGEYYSVQFAEKDGLSVRHRLARFDQRMFLMLFVEVTNTGTAPVRIEKIAPAVAGPGAIRNLSPESEIIQRTFLSPAGTPLFAPGKAGSLALFRDPEKGITFGVGVLPEGRAETGLDFQPAAGRWQGEAYCSYAPYVELAPGETLKSDSVLIFHAYPDPHSIDLRYAWVASTLPRVASPAPPRVWVGVEETAPLSELAAAAGAWRAAGVSHALIPRYWESRPGSMAGATPRYPRKIESAAKTLRAAGVAPGITLDVHAYQGKKRSWTAETAEGFGWVNLRDADARRYVQDKARQLVKDGFAFIAVARPTTPPEVLAKFGLTRAEASRLALGYVAEAAKSIPVFPAATGAVRPERDAWLEAAAAVSRFPDYGVTVGPVRLSAENLGAVDEDTGLAMRLWPGSIELRGKPDSAARKTIQGLLRDGVLRAYPLDGGKRGPLLWQSDFDADALGYVGSAVLAFPGAPSWDAATINPPQAETTLAWRQADGTTFDLSQSPVRTNGKTTVTGICPVNGHPMLMGLSEGPLLHLDRLESLSWNQSTGALSGNLRGPFEKTLAHVLVPAPWSYDKGKVNGRSLRIKSPGHRITFEVESGGAQFDLRFKRR